MRAKQVCTYIFTACLDLHEGIGALIGCSPRVTKAVQAWTSFCPQNRGQQTRLGAAALTVIDRYRDCRRCCTLTSEQAMYLNLLLRCNTTRPRHPQTVWNAEHCATINPLLHTMVLQHYPSPEAHTPAVCAVHVDPQHCNASSVVAGMLLLQPVACWQPAGLQLASLKARETKHSVLAQQMPAGPLASQQTVPVHLARRPGNWGPCCVCQLLTCRVARKAQTRIEASGVFRSNDTTTGPAKRLVTRPARWLTQPAPRLTTSLGAKIKTQSVCQRLLQPP